MIKNISTLIKYRELLIAFTMREVKVRYKETILGAFWAIIQPLSLMIVFTLIFSYFLKIETDGIPYPLFSYSALLPWTFFTTSLSFGSIGLVNNYSLITKVYFPRETIPLSSIGAAFLDFLTAGFVFAILMVYYKVSITFNLLFLIPIILSLVIFTSAIVLFTSALIVIWRDIKFVVPFVTQLWIFATPVIYPVSKVPERFRVIYTLDPIVPIITSFRSVVLGGKPSIVDIFTAAFMSCILFVFAYWFFKSKEKIFADII